MGIYAYSLEILVIKYYSFTIRKVNNKIDESFPKNNLNQEIDTHF